MWFWEAPGPNARILVFPGDVHTGWFSLGGQCFGGDDVCGFAVHFVSLDGEFVDEEAWLSRFVRRRDDDKPVWELMDRFRAAGSPWELHSAWECFDESGDRGLAVANPDGTVRSVLNVDEVNGRFVTSDLSEWTCHEVMD
jgi:hypothetical protein